MLLRRPFRFRGCLVTKSQQRRAHTASIIPVTTHDHTLRDFFDQPHKPLLRGTNVPKGLLGYPQIASPESFVPVTAATMARANYIVRRIIQVGNNEGERMRIVKNIDRLSDLLCGVIDMAELIRHTHPERAWVDAANQAYDTLCEYMNHLNTNVDLARALDDFMASPSFKNLPMEAKQTAWIFKHDFDKSGVHLPVQQRQKFVELSSNIISLGRDFLQGLGAEKKPITLFTKDCEGVPETPRLWQLYSVKRGLRSRVAVEPNSAEARRVLKHSTNEEARKKVYVSQNASSNEQIQVLEQLLRDRAELAVLVGRQSYGEMLLHDKMGKKPEHVHEFLGSLLEFSRPRALAALNDVKQAKKRSQGLSYLPEIYAWDREAYFPSKSLEPPIPLPRLTPGLALCAFSRLLKHIYGISCEPADVERGEVWHDDVRKVNIVDESEGIIGWIYLDLFYREGKAGGATHYTLRCSRRVDDDDAANDFLPSDQGRELTPDLEERLVIRSESHVTPGRDGSHQRPVAAISCDFDANSPRGMDWQDVVTLWHELGHAMHSMIGRTEYGNVAGTRCATDFVELPSILMEHFLTSPHVLSLFYLDTPPPLFSTLDLDHIPPTRSHYQAIEAHNHILLAMLDQHYHSTIALSPSFDSTRELAKVETAYGVLPHVEGTSWQTSFGHLFSYGASYYSYLFDRAIASRVWSRVFRGEEPGQGQGQRPGRGGGGEGGPLSRENGERFKAGVLRFGGGKDPWEMVAGLLKEPMLREGDLNAMREVGRWGVDDVASGGPLA